jgi:hypothetical protein
MAALMAAARKETTVFDRAGKHFIRELFCIIYTDCDYLREAIKPKPARVHVDNTIVTQRALFG